MTRVRFYVSEKIRSLTLRPIDLRCGEISYQRADVCRLRTLSVVIELGKSGEKANLVYYQILERRDRSALESAKYSISISNSKCLRLRRFPWRCPQKTREWR